MHKQIGCNFRVSDRYDKKCLTYTKCDMKMASKMVCYNIGTYVGEDQLHSGLLVDKRPKTI